MSTITYGKLYLIPNFLSEDNSDDFIAEMVRRLVHHLKHFVVENEKQGRALIKRLRLENSQQDLHIWVLNEHTQAQEVPSLLKALEGNDAGIISDAGLPCIADPGSALVALAQTKNIEVVPLPGGSSMIMALMGSGFSGQQFTFLGYLPIDKTQKIKRIKELEQLALKSQQAQFFIETPYRNASMFDALTEVLSPQTKVFIGRDIGAQNQLLVSKTVSEWKKIQKPDLHKVPVVYGICT